jgi:hypothetical protein
MLILAIKEVRITISGFCAMRFGAEPVQFRLQGFWFIYPETSLHEKMQGKKEN